MATNPPPHQTTSQKLRLKGFRAESLVIRELEKESWHIYARNYRYIGCEIDIIAQKGDTLAFIEVKARQRFPQTMADMLTLISPRKQQAMQRGAQSAITRLNLRDAKHYRFDLAVVVQATSRSEPEMVYYVNAFN